MDGPDSPIESLNALTLVTADMAASVAFYCALGFMTAFGGADSAFTTFHVGDGFLNLQLDADFTGVARVWGRPIFFVDDVDAMFGRAVAAGYTPSRSPSNAPWGERYFHISDPAGHEISFARPIR
jgi:catechol 2,3-dioxygenase-like lactoylglutathione lyase family enzyme